jgi:uncharacterized protein YegP (UPF0339 family)
MNLFVLDYDLGINASYHMDKHVGKMQLEAAQMLTTTIWVDRFVGTAPRMLTHEELNIITKAKAKQPSIEERSFTRYLPTHINHPCSVWVRSSLDNYFWTLEYVQALNDESIFRGYKSHASCEEAVSLPRPENVPDTGELTPFVLAMPDRFKKDNAVDSYREYYRVYKQDIATWRVRQPPYWW